MANVKLAAGVWVDLYAATGITVGDIIDVMNISPNTVRVASSVAEPTVSDDHIPVEKDRGKARNELGDLGAWALSVGGGAVDVQAV